MNRPLSTAQRQALRSASQWYALLNDDTVTAQQRTRWQQWYERDKDHQWAWQQVERLRAQIGVVPGSVASRALRDAEVTRRHVLKGLVVLLTIGSSYPLSHTEVVQGWRADYRTAKGVIRHQQLSDGSLLTLNTNTAVDVDFNSQQRVLKLRYGEIAITTAKDVQQRPFRVLTQQGQLTALGTQFSVEQQADTTYLAVRQHAVAVQLAENPAKKLVIHAGESVLFTASHCGKIMPLAKSNLEWLRGVISFSDTPLAEVIRVLSRYRPGILRCDPAVADLRLTGTFSLQDTDAVLVLITKTLPVSIHSLTRYWLTIVPRQEK